MGNEIQIQYELIDSIGISRLGMLYKSKVKDKEEYRALKILKKEEIKDYNKINNYINNIKICGQNNNNSVKLYEAYGSGNKIVVVMELCDENLMQLISRKNEPFSINEIYNILIQLNNSFKIMSKEKIIHGALKFENILVKYDNKEKTKYTLKISDFGINEIIDEPKKRMDKLYFIAPEILKGENYDYKCDLWSLGVIIYYLYFQAYPFNAENKNEILLKNNNPEVCTLKKTGNDDLDNLIDRLLTIDPNKRITWNEYFDHPFFNEKQNLYNNFDAKKVELKKYEKDYNEGDFWDKIKKVAIKIGAKPVFIALLLYYAIPRVSLIDKAIIIGSLGYLISPLDLIPDTIPVIGLLDDTAVLMLAFYRIKSNIDENTKIQAVMKFRTIFNNYSDEEIENFLN
jgi:serine/threonine protein kinase